MCSLHEYLYGTSHRIVSTLQSPKHHRQSADVILSDVDCHMPIPGFCKNNMNRAYFFLDAREGDIAFDVSLLGHASDSPTALSTSTCTNSEVQDMHDSRGKRSISEATTTTKTRWLHMHSIPSFHLIHQIAQPLHARDTNIANWFVRPPLNSSLLTLALHKPPITSRWLGEDHERIP